MAPRLVPAALVLCLVCLAAPLRAGAVVYPTGSTVEGKTLPQWAGEWWQKTFSIPVYAADGKTIINPQFDNPLNPGDMVAATHALPSNDGKVFFLFGSFFGGPIDRTVRVPAGTPLFVPIANSEWSNADTPAKPDFKTVPGNYTLAELVAFAKIEADATTGLTASLDGQSIPNVASHRETTPSFTYSEPASKGVHDVFFGLHVTNEPAAADGVFLMLRPLSPGEHTLHFTGEVPDLSGTPPLLGATSIDTTYHITATAAVPLPAGAWLGLSALPLAGLAVRRAGRLGGGHAGR